MKDRIDDAENDLTVKMVGLSSKNEREALVRKVDEEIQKIESQYASLMKANRKIRNKHMQKTAKKKLQGEGVDIVVYTGYDYI